MVVFPAPVSPTSATVCPAGIRRLRSGNTVVSRYPKRTERSRSSRPAPLRGGSSAGISGSGTPGGSSSTPEIFSKAAPADWKLL
jgi:hypothetical protein